MTIIFFYLSGEYFTFIEFHSPSLYPDDCTISHRCHFHSQVFLLIAIDVWEWWYLYLEVRLTSSTFFTLIPYTSTDTCSLSWASRQNLFLAILSGSVMQFPFTDHPLHMNFFHIWSYDSPIDMTYAIRMTIQPKCHTVTEAIRFNPTFHLAVHGVLQGGLEHCGPPVDDVDPASLLLLLDAPLQRLDEVLV